MKKNIITILIGTISLFNSFIMAIFAMFFALRMISKEFEHSGYINAFLISFFLSAALLIPFVIYKIFVTRKKKKLDFAEGVLSALVLKYPEKIKKEDVLVDLVDAVNIGGKLPIEALDELLINRYGIRATLVSVSEITEERKFVNDLVAKLPSLEGSTLERGRLNLESRKNVLKAMEDQRHEFERIYKKSSNNYVIALLTPYIVSLVLGFAIIFTHNQGIFTIPTPSFFGIFSFYDTFDITYLYIFHFGVIIASAIYNFIIPYKSLNQSFS